MTIEDFLQNLQQRDLVPPSIVEQVRAKVEQGDRRITPKSLLKYLVQKELVTKRQAQQLLETTLTVSPSAESSILGTWQTVTPPQPANDPGTSPPDNTEQDDEVIPTLAPLDEEGDSHGSSIHGSSVLVTEESSHVSSADLFGEAPPSSLLAESLSAIGAVGADATLAEAIDQGNQERQGPPGKSKPRTRRKKANQNEWDSSLLLLGGGGLVLLILTGVLVGYFLMREDADAVLAEANTFYEGGSYTQAIKQYQRFTENHTQHPEFSDARVKLGLAQLWRACSSTSDYRPALQTAEQVLRDCEEESAFPSAQLDLASLLPKIAQGLANQAEQETDGAKIQALVAQTQGALALCANTKYIPSRFRDQVLLSEIDATLDRVERSQAQNSALQQALLDMQAAIDQHATAQAYQIHEALTDAHPGLLKNESLAAAVAAISSAEAATVQVVAQSQPALTEPRPSTIVATLALAHSQGPTGSQGPTSSQGPTGATDPAAKPSGKIVAVRVQGSVYGLDLTSGDLGWTRSVGPGAKLPALQLPSGDLLVVDSLTHELLKLAGASGDLIWRQAFDGPVLRPVLCRDEVLVTEVSGKLHRVAIDSGERLGYVQFAQRLTSPPAVGANRLYLAAEHSSLYTLSTDDFSCLGVFFLGHASNSITTPPAVVLNQVLVAVAKGISTSHLEVLSTTDDGIPTERIASRRLTGLVNTDLLAAGRRLVALTSQGQVSVFEVGPSTLTLLATRDAERGAQRARFGALDQGAIWVAGPRLNKLTLLPTSDRLPVSNIDQDYQGDTFDAPLQIVGTQLIHVRRPAGQAGFRVAATDLVSGQSQWETALASPLAGPPAIDPVGMQLSTITASGLAYAIDREAMRARVTSRALQLRSSRKLPPLTHSLDLGDGRMVASAPQRTTLLHFRPGLPRNALQRIELPSPLSGAAVSWGDHFVVPTRSGQVYLYSKDEGTVQGSPFQPPLVPGAQYDWLRPAVYGTGEDSQLVLSDGKKKIYLLRRLSSPQPHLTAVAEADLSSAPLNTRLAVLGNLAVAGTEKGSLAVYQLPALEARPPVAVQGVLTWGPFVVGEHLLAATANEELICLDRSAALRWRQPLAHGTPTGTPLAHPSGALLLWRKGVVSTLNLADGAERAQSQLDQPVVAGPVPFGRRLIVTSPAGALLVVNPPE